MKKLLFALFLGLGFNALAQIPTLDWVRVQGSTHIIVPTSSTSDTAGNVYVAGIFRGVNTFGGGNTNTNIQQMFVEKFDANGTLLWSQIFNSNSANYDYISGIEVDGSGNIYTTGYFQGTVDFNPSSATANLVSAGGNDVFIQKFNSSGNLLWAKRIGGTGQDKGHALGIDANKNIYIAGSYTGTVDFNPDAGTNASTSGGGLDGFVVKLDSNGTYLWHNLLYDLYDSEYTTIAVTASGDNYAAGYSYESHTFNRSRVVAQKRNPAGTNAWYYSSSSIYTSSLGRTHSIAVDVDGNAYLTGIYGGSMNFGNGYVSSGNGNYILKLNTAGLFSWFKEPNIQPSKIAINTQQQVFVLGTLFGSAFMHADAPAGFSLRSAGDRDPLMIQWDSAGTFVWASRFGGPNTDEGLTMTIDPSNKIILGGIFSGTADFDPSAAADSATGPHPHSMYVLKLDQCTYGRRVDSLSSCSSFTWTNGNGQTYSGSTSAFHILAGAASNGCDSIVQLKLTINYPTYNRISDTACGSYTWAVNGQTYQSSGTYVHTLPIPNVMGCDSNLMLTLQLYNNPTGTDQRQNCGPLVWIDGNTYTRSSSNAATYTLVGAAANGCDSVVTLNFVNLGIDPDHIFIYQGQIITEEDADTYQWIDCDNNNAPIGGATQSGFRPTRNGNYALITTVNGCTTTSNCLSYNLSGLEQQQQRPAIYPNPSKGEVNIELQGLSAVRITNVQGQVLYQVQDLSHSLHRVEFKPGAGLYFIEVERQGQRSVHKLIIE